MTHANLVVVGDPADEARASAHPRHVRQRSTSPRHRSDEKEKRARAKVVYRTVPIGASVEIRSACDEIVGSYFGYPPSPSVQVGVRVDQAELYGFLSYVDEMRWWRVDGYDCEYTMKVW